MTKWWKVLALLTGMIVMITPSFGVEKNIDFKIMQPSLSEGLYEKALELIAKYPELLELEVIGTSEDNKPIYVIRMTEAISTYEDVDYVKKTHLLVDGGVHARETYNPVAVLKMVEDYVLDYYNDAYLPAYNVRELLKSSVFHFIPIVNPDGFDIAKRGISTLDNPEMRSAIMTLMPNLRNYRLKANARGVDINRNFEDVYYNVNTNAWINQWAEGERFREPTAPAEDYFKGYSPASESETQSLMTYMLRYDFRAYITYHSMGQVIYYWIDHLGYDYYYMNKSFANLAANITNYKLMVPDQTNEFGYSTHFFSNNTLKPAITLETTSSHEFPTPLANYYYDYNYNKIWAVPLAFLVKAKNMGYFDNKIYVDGVYVRDVSNLEVAEALAEKLGGEVYIFKGAPSYRLSKQVTVEVKDQFVLSRNLQTSDGRTYVEFKELFEMLNYEITWITELNTAVALKDKTVYGINPATLEMVCEIDGISSILELKTSPILYKGRLMVPLEFMLNVLGITEDSIEIIEGKEIVFKDL